MKELRVLYVIPGEDEGSCFIFARRQVNTLEREGIVAERFFLRSRTSPLSLLQERRRLRKLFRDFQPDLVHAQYGTMTSFLCMLAVPEPMVITFRGTDLLPDHDVAWLRHASGHLLSQISAFRATGIICVSEELRSSLWRKRFRNMAEVITGAINLDVFRLVPQGVAREALGWPHEGKVVVFNIGDAPRRKRLDLAQGAVAYANHVRGDVRLELMSRLPGSGIGREVPPDQVPLWMNAADCLIMASDVEGSPNVVREAMACNLPVVSVVVGDAPERLKDVHPSRIVERDPEALGRAVLEILELNCRSNGRDIVARDLSEARMVERVLDMYARALKRS